MKSRSAGLRLALPLLLLMPLLLTGCCGEAAGRLRLPKVRPPDRAAELERATRAVLWRTRGGAKEALVPGWVMKLRGDEHQRWKDYALTLEALIRAQEGGE